METFTVTGVPSGDPPLSIVNVRVPAATVPVGLVTVALRGTVCSVALKGVEVLAISVDADQSAYQDFLKEHKVDLLTVRDADQKSNNLYATFKFPETYIIDRDGVLRRKFIGAIDWGTPEIQDYLSKL